MRALLSVVGIVVLLFILMVEAIFAEAQPLNCEVWSAGLASSAAEVINDDLSLSDHQVSMAKLILGVTAAEGHPRRAAVIAIATAIQESRLRNIDFGDEAGPDSRGLFQQRALSYPTINRLDPAQATRAFLDRLVEVPLWEIKPLTEVAQAVQVSAHPDAYGQWEDEAEVIVTKWWHLDNPAECAPLPEGVVGIEETTVVGGIRVHISIAGQVQSLLNGARSDGLILTGWGWRDSQQQIGLRKAHCGTSQYAIYEMPSSQCRPPTARPGRSMHERGLAIDFQNCSTRSTRCFQWLRANAANYGLFNLPSEPWHWSTNGN